MGKKVASLAFALILFFAAVSVDAHYCQANKKRDDSPLVKRGYEESQQCPCAVAQAVFTDAVGGITVYAQNECGQTEITGFLTGLVNPDVNKYTFFIKKCGRIIANLTDVLNAQINANGTTQFTALDKNLNLNCDKDGIFNIVCDPCNNTYSSHGYKRQGQSPSMQINQNGNGYGQAPINSI